MPGAKGNRVGLLPEEISTPEISAVKLASAFQELVDQAVENETTPDVPEQEAAASGASIKTISPTSAAVLQSIFFKEMVFKTKLDRDSSSSLSSSEDSPVKDEPVCSCGKHHDDSDESVVDLAPAKKQLLFDERDESTDEADEDEFESAEEEDQDLSKRGTLIAILEKFQTDVQKEKAREDAANKANKKAVIEIADGPANEEQHEVEAAPEANQAEPVNLVQEVEVNEPEGQDKENVGVQEANVPHANAMTNFEEVNLENVIAEVEEEQQQQHEAPAVDAMRAYRRSPEELQLFFLNKYTPNLEPYFKDDSWLVGQPMVPIRQALANVGVCATELLMDTLREDPTLYHFRNEDNWFGRHQMSFKGMVAVLARIGLMDLASRNFRLARENLQGFSGTYLFLRHAMDHGNFDSAHLHILQAKAESLLERDYNNNEGSRCKAITNRLSSSQEEVPNDGIDALVHIGENVQLVRYPPLALSVRQPINQMPLSPRVLNHQQGRENISPRKRAYGNMSKENAQNHAPPAKRFAYDESTVAAMHLNYY